MTRCTSKKHLFPAGRKGVVFSFGAGELAHLCRFPAGGRGAGRLGEGIKLFFGDYG